MRIAYLLTQEKGGPVDVTVPLAAAVSDRGHTVALFGPRPARGPELVDGMLVAQEVGRKDDLRAIAAMRKSLRAWGADVIHAQDRRSGLVVSGMQWRPGGPRAVVHTYHGVPEDVSQAWFAGVRDAAPPSRYTQVKLGADSLVARSLTRTIVPAASMGDFLRDRLRVPASTVTQVDNGVRLPDPAPPSGPVRKLLCVALLVPRKGIADLLDALARPGVLAEGTTLTVAGDGPERASLEERAAHGLLAGRVEFLGFRTDIPSLLAAHDALVLPSHMEQQPLALAEAMGAAKPVVATATGGVAEMLNVAGAASYVVPPGDPGALGDALERLQADPDPAALGRALRERAERRYSVDACADAHLALYSSLLR
ncbi:glycosyltransferase family 4 protein [Tsukamurella sp. 8F]|uniref:glycosyltransferase family 4 protein n=1 Tax=unclassified Tsukamurella TaxID=2633480 RepID=UPI0023B8982F|nr:MULTISPECIES: glycosyltransferase family 4 protein [unclassified Tsukamurella]MDF0530680.1 glycosyltransferase family 4 protein [Tsukamurella sp. 8J]MDF0587881.1 glycosyltransferase family 4 protein [Tsukamurella sp. 8F]